MFIDILIRLVNIAASLLILLIILDVILSYILDVYHPVRRTLDQIISPLLNPIRRAVPLVGMFDFSAFILIILIWILQSALVNLLFALR